MLKHFTEEKVRDLYREKKKMYRGKKFLPILAMLLDDLQQISLMHYVDENNAKQLLLDFYAEEGITLADMQGELYPIISNGPTGLMYFCWPIQLHTVLEMFCDLDEITAFYENDDFRDALYSCVNKIWERLFKRGARERIARKYLQYCPKKVFETSEYVNQTQNTVWYFQLIEIDRFFSWCELMSDYKMMDLFKMIRIRIRFNKEEGVNPFDEKTATVVEDLLDEKILMIRKKHLGNNKDNGKSLQLRHREQEKFFRKIKIATKLSSVIKTYYLVANPNRGWR